MRVCHGVSARSGKLLILLPVHINRNQGFHRALIAVGSFGDFVINNVLKVNACHSHNVIVPFCRNSELNLHIRQNGLIGRGRIIGACGLQGFYSCLNRFPQGLYHINVQIQYTRAKEIIRRRFIRISNIGYTSLSVLYAAELRMVSGKGVLIYLIAIGTNRFCR